MNSIAVSVRKFSDTNLRRIAWKVTVFGVLLVRFFLHSDWIRRDTKSAVQNAEKYGPEKLWIRTLFINIYDHIASQLENSCRLPFSCPKYSMKLVDNALQKSSYFVHIIVFCIFLCLSKMQTIGIFRTLSNYLRWSVLWK